MLNATPACAPGHHAVSLSRWMLETARDQLVLSLPRCALMLGGELYIEIRIGGLLYPSLLGCHYFQALQWS